MPEETILEGNEVVQDDYVASPEEVIEGADAPDAADSEPTPTAAKPSYTPDELADLLMNDKPIDSTRLTLEGQALMRSFDRGYSRKWETLANERKALQMEREQRAAISQPVNSSPLDQAFAEFVRNPMGTMNTINQEIAQLEQVKPYDEKYSQARAAISNLNSVKDYFNTKRMQVEQEQMQTSTFVTAYQQAVKEHLPADFQAKAPLLEEFAIKELGFTKQELSTLADPRMTGLLSVKLSKAILTMYNKLNPTPDKAAPRPLASGGTGTAAAQAGSVGNNLQSLFEKAKKTGDWIPYLAAKDRAAGKVRR